MNLPDDGKSRIWTNISAIRTLCKMIQLTGITGIQLRMCKLHAIENACDRFWFLSQFFTLLLAGAGNAGAATPSDWRTTMFKFSQTKFGTEWSQTKQSSVKFDVFPFMWTSESASAQWLSARLFAFAEIVHDVSYRWTYTYECRNKYQLGRYKTKRNEVKRIVSTKLRWNSRIRSKMSTSPFYRSIYVIVFGSRPNGNHSNNCAKFSIQQMECVRGKIKTSVENSQWISNVLAK